ncbi:hypothetical protein PG996_001153 [Apiospora saccharicola]|uniref:Uncharacterized protein n=1 Tax=Apiospora saccharicola TaxID=335842 RepID=A0ABR1WHB2_9PEZI
MQNILAVILLTIAALEGALAAPVGDAVAVDVGTNDNFPASASFEGAEEIYARNVNEDDEKNYISNAPGPVADPIPLDSAPDMSEEPSAVGPRDLDEIEERDLAEEDDQLEARDLDTENAGGLEKRDAVVVAEEVAAATKAAPRRGLAVASETTAEAR